MPLEASGALVGLEAPPSSLSALVAFTRATATKPAKGIKGSKNIKEEK